jgi:hypothetical protein
MSSGITAISGMQAADLAAHAGGRNSAPATAPYAPQPAATTAAQMTPNPSMRIDSALSLVVMEFHGTDGKVENSIPTVQQLDAYRRSQGADHGGASSSAAAQPAAPSAAAADQAVAGQRQAPATPIVA